LDIIATLSKSRLSACISVCRFAFPALQYERAPTQWTFLASIQAGKYSDLMDERFLSTAFSFADFQKTLEQECLGARLTPQTPMVPNGGILNRLTTQLSITSKCSGDTHQREEFVR